jgi:hypothetical protein
MKKPLRRLSTRNPKKTQHNSQNRHNVREDKKKQPAQTGCFFLSGYHFLTLRPRRLGQFLFLPLKVACAFFACEATPHPFCCFVETRIVELAGEITHTSPFFAHDRVCHISAIPFRLRHLSSVSLLFWHFDCLLIKAISFEGCFSSHR